MADQDQISEVNLRKNDQVANNNDLGTANYQEESSAEIAAPVTFGKGSTADASKGGQTAAGSGVGITALALSILSLFFFPVLFGVAGIVLGFVARRRGAQGLGAWAIGIGALSLFIRMFIMPFF